VRVSARTDYALRALLVLADRAPALVKVEVISAEEGMPRKFVEVILGELRRAGLVVSRRGSDGGFGLAMPAERITVGDVVRIADGPLGGEPGRAGAAPGRLADVWTAATVSVADVLDRTTLAHVRSGCLPDHVRELAGRGGEVR